MMTLASEKRNIHSTKGASENQALEKRNVFYFKHQDSVNFSVLILPT